MYIRDFDSFCILNWGIPREVSELCMLQSIFYHQCMTIDGVSAMFYIRMANLVNILRPQNIEGFLIAFREVNFP